MLWAVDWLQTAQQPIADLRVPRNLVPAQYPWIFLQVLGVAKAYLLLPVGKHPPPPGWPDYGQRKADCTRKQRLPRHVSWHCFRRRKHPPLAGAGKTDTSVSHLFCPETQRPLHAQTQEH